MTPKQHGKCGRTRYSVAEPADIRSFFDEVCQERLIKFLQHRIADPRLLRLIQKWLKAGVLADGKVEVSDRGTPQGAVIAPPTI